MHIFDLFIVKSFVFHSILLKLNFISFNVVKIRKYLLGSIHTFEISLNQSTRQVDE